MTYPRFFLLKRRFRLHDPDSITAGVPHPFSKVAEWSDIQQAAATRFWEPGTNVAVDEGIVPFQGRSRITVDMQDRPDGEGIKVHWSASLTMPSTSGPQGGLEGAHGSAGGPRQGGVVRRVM